MKVFIVIEVPEVPDVDSVEATEVLECIQAELKHFPYSWFIDEAESTPAVVEDEVDPIVEAALVAALVARGFNQDAMKRATDPT